jgi:phospholipid transport system substrate-binding protein
MTPCPSLVLALFLGAAAPTFAEDTAVAITKSTVDTVTATLQNEELDYDAKRKAIDKILRERVDQRILSQLVLARNWKKLNDTQQDEFVKLFMDHLVLTYWDNLESADISGVEVTSDREETRGDWTVKTKVELDTGKDSVLIDYRLRRKKVDGEAKGPWLIIDIIVEGVSMVSNFRAQLGEVYSNGGADHLIDAIKKKNATLNERLSKEHAKK